MNRDEWWWLVRKSVGLLLLIVLAAIILVSFANIVLVALTGFLFSVALWPPVKKLKHLGVPQAFAAPIVLALVFAVIALLLWLFIPRLIQEVQNLSLNIPHYFSQVTGHLNELLYGEGQQLVSLSEFQEQLLPATQTIVTLLTGYFFTGVQSVVMLLIFVSIVLYTLQQPQPLIEFYLGLFREGGREQAADAFIKGMRATQGWIKANLIVGGIEGVIAGIFLAFYGIPGAFVWGLLTFFSELIPKLGPYLMSIPPALVAFAQEPIKALWVLVFYFILQQAIGDVLGVKIRGSAMNVHPVFLIIFVIGMGFQFGILGALIATPIAGFVQAIYEVFYHQNLNKRQLQKFQEKILG